MSRYRFARSLVCLATVVGLLSFAVVVVAQGNCVQPSGQQLIVYHAGSLTAAFTPVEQAFTCQTGVQIQDNIGGSVDLLRQVTAGGKPADVVASADYVAMDQLLKPTKVASYTVVFAHGRMVLAYLDSDIGASGKNLPPLLDPNGPQFAPPSSIPNVVDNWHEILLRPGIVVGTSHPFLDPSGYRAHLMAQLEQAHAGVPNLANDLLEHYVATPAAAPANAFALGKQYDFQFIYEHSAQAAAQTNPDYRYATRTAWGLTIMNSAPNRENAIKFLQMLLAPEGTGQSSLRKVGPEPISPPIVTQADWAQLPAELQSIIKSGDPLAS